MGGKISPGDTAWVLVATAFVLMMTPALAFFYGGMVRKKNILSTLNLSFITIGIISIQWVLIGYTLAFGRNVGGIIGCLLYTSDAADDLLCVDLGGRRILKTKK